MKGRRKWEGFGAWDSPLYSTLFGSSRVNQERCSILKKVHIDAKVIGCICGMLGLGVFL